MFCIVVMAELVEREVGRRIREIREARGLSLKALAERCGLSLNAISRIERGESSPTVASLHRLAAALDVPVTDFFASAGGQSIVLVRRNQRLRTRGEGVMLESLGSGLPGQRLEPFLMTLSPGAASSQQEIVHGGEELAYCVAGEVEYQVGAERHRLEVGDSILFRAEHPHLCRNVGLEQAVVLFVIRAPDEEGRLSYQMHLMTGD
jgi:transcriptional regulator with XRE-family HTH domain